MRLRPSPARGAWLAFASVLGWAPAALACPTCATREAGGVGVYVAIGAMIAVPYVIAMVAFRAIRKLERQ